jgi:hypothetical protein
MSSHHSASWQPPVTLRGLNVLNIRVPTGRALWLPGGRLPFNVVFTRLNSRAFTIGQSFTFACEAVHNLYRLSSFHRWFIRRLTKLVTL